MGRIANAVSKPGIDPRVWVSYGVVTAFNVDPDHGVFADVTLHPSEEKVTARVCPLAAGGGWGIYAPLRVDDEVIVANPNGDGGDGPVVFARPWSPADLPPQEAVDNPDDMLIRVEDGRVLRVVTSGGGNIVLDVGTGAGIVQIGSGTTSDKVLLGSTYVSAMSSLLTTLATHTHGTAVGPTTPPTEAAAISASTTGTDAMLSTKAEVAK
jgi:hypothetical protein